MKGFLPLALVLFLFPGCTEAQAPDRGTEKRQALRDNLMAAVKGLPQDLAEAILASPEEFLADLKTLLPDRDILTLVDKNHSLTEADAPPDLVSLKDLPGVTASRDGLTLRQRIVPGILALAEGARKAGHPLVWSSAYRSYTYQHQVFSRYAARDGEEKANTYSARPGQSQHQLGTAADFGDITLAFGRTPSGRWLKAHAWEYGWSLSFPEGLQNLTGYQYEPWHFRYIGLPAARVQKKWFGDIQHHLLTFLHYHGDLLREL